MVGSAAKKVACQACNGDQVLSVLSEIRNATKGRESDGLPKAEILKFAAIDPDLGEACNMAREAFADLRQRHPEITNTPEPELIKLVQSGLMNFYGPDSVSPYIPIAGKGPWIVTSHGAVIYDTGGYGMLGFGHNPTPVCEALAKPVAQANVMTPSFSQADFLAAIRAMIGMSRKAGQPNYEQFVCLNSGSEGNALALRISDAHARGMVDPGGRYAGRTVRYVSLKGAFHGRTLQAAMASDSSAKYYDPALATFRGNFERLTVEPNNVADLERVFAEADSKNIYIEAMLLEPVMGEGNPGVATTRAFYDAARRLTKAHGSLLLIDSIQAGLRATGCLSIIDYPGFEDAEIPDMETFSKAVNAGQYPLSVVALTKEAAAMYKPNIYGNTMTTNPRVLEVAKAAMQMVTPEMVANIRARGLEFVDKLKQLQKSLPTAIEGVQGTGLLVSAALEPKKFPVTGLKGVERWLRCHGVNVIHGGKNALRFTPHFNVTSAEIDLIVDLTRQGIEHFKTL